LNLADPRKSCDYKQHVSVSKTMLVLAFAVLISIILDFIVNNKSTQLRQLEIGVLQGSIS